MNDLHKKIETLCNQHGITCNKLCKDLGWYGSVLTELKAGRTKSLSLKKLEMIANYFDIPVNYFIDDNENEPTPKFESELNRTTGYMKLNNANKKKVDELIDMLLRLQSIDE